MRKKHPALLCIALTTLMAGITLHGNAQTIAPDVIASAGGHYAPSGNAPQLSWTLGQSMVRTLSSPGNMLTQGFHQPGLGVVSVQEHTMSGLRVSVFPNLASDRVTVRTNDNLGILIADLYDLSGRILRSITIGHGQRQTDIPLSGLAHSCYLLRIHSPETGHGSTHRIIKTLE